MEQNLKSISEVIIRLARKIQASTDLTAIVRRFSAKPRGVRVVVGGYAAKVLTEDDAPFVWIYPDTSEFNCHGGFIKSFKANIVVGVCPMKDLPSSTQCEKAFQEVEQKLNNTNRFLEIARPECFAALDRGDPDAAQANKERYQAVVNTLVNIVNNSHAVEQEALAKIAVADVESAISKWREALTLLSEVTRQLVDVGTVFDAAYNAGTSEQREKIRHYIEELDAWVELDGTLIAMARDEVEEIASDLAEWAEDPYIVEKVSERGDNTNGLEIYGSIRQFDAVRNTIYQIVKHNDCGLIVEAFDCRVNSDAHFPLDWIEASVTFTQPSYL